MRDSYATITPVQDAPYPATLRAAIADLEREGKHVVRVTRLGRTLDGMTEQFAVSYTSTVTEIVAVHPLEVIK